MTADGLLHRDRKQKRAAVRLTGENKAVVLKWLAHRRLIFEEGQQTTQSLISRIFANDMLSIPGKRSIYEIKRTDLLETGRIDFLGFVAQQAA